MKHASELSAAEWLEVGHSCLRSERYRESIVAYRQALELDPQLHDAHRYLWSGIAGLGELKDAVRALKRKLETLDEDFAPLRERIAVPDTTLCIVDCQNYALAERALRLSMRGCAFEAVRFLTDRDRNLRDVETIVIPKIDSVQSYSRFIAKDLLRYVDTEYVLVIQWDGYVINPMAWNPQFLLFDYIGARWLHSEHRVRPHHNVGNGGFSLRSRTLLEALQDEVIQELDPEDTMICRVYREWLEERYRIAFAPDAVADQFAFEHTHPTNIPLGFHGVVNFARLIPDPELTLISFWDGYRPRSARAPAA